MHPSVSRSRKGEDHPAMTLCTRVSIPGPWESASPHCSGKKEKLFPWKGSAGRQRGWCCNGTPTPSGQGKGPDLLLRPLSHLMGPLIMNASLKHNFFSNKNVTPVLYVSQIGIYNFITFTCSTRNETLNCLHIQTCGNLMGTEIFSPLPQY